MKNNDNSAWSFGIQLAGYKMDEYGYFSGKRLSHKFQIVITVKAFKSIQNFYFNLFKRHVKEESI